MNSTNSGTISPASKTSLLARQRTFLARLLIRVGLVNSRFTERLALKIAPWLDEHEKPSNLDRQG
jgi:hypothetical protein